jgi:hypothetical protein
MKEEMAVIGPPKPITSGIPAVTTPIAHSVSPPSRVPIFDMCVVLRRLLINSAELGHQPPADACVGTDWV